MSCGRTSCPKKGMDRSASGVMNALPNSPKSGITTALSSSAAAEAFRI